MNLASKLEAVLFVAGEPVSVARLARVLGTGEADVARALEELRSGHRERASGLTILQSPEGFQLVTEAEAHAAVETFVTSGRRERLTPAAAETLAIIAYRGPVSRAGIEAIRGVNSQFTLRLLALRGLVSRGPHPADQRRLVYEISADFLRNLGIARLEDLPDFAELRQHQGMTKLQQEAEPPDPQTSESGVRDTR